MAVNDLITFRKGTASQWISANPVLASGEPGYDLTNSILKIGDGVSNWVALSGIGSTSVGGGGSSSTSVIEYGSVSNFPVSGVGSTIYISTDNGRMYRWASTVYQELGPISYAPIGSDSRWNLFLPPAPMGLSVTAGNTQATLSWNAPTVSTQTPITDYTVQYSSNSGSTWTTFTRSVSTSTTETVTGLTNGQGYVLRVAAINGIGTGAYSTASSVVTPTAFSPSSIGGLQLWLDASDATTLYDATTGGSLVAADGAVARWQDKSGNGRHATQSTIADRPARKTAIQNGYDVIRADGNSDFLQTPAFSSDLVRSVFLVAISRETPQQDTYACLLGQVDGDFGGGDTDPWLIGTTNGGTGSQFNRLRCVVRNAADDGFITNFVDEAFATGTPFLTSYLNSGTGVFRFGASSATFPTAGLHASFTKKLTIFSQANDDATQTTNLWDGDICEIIIYNSALSDTDRAAVESYLMTKWSIA
jgi:hypothetical protein